MARYPITYSEAINWFLEDKFEEHGIEIPEDLEFDKIADIFGQLCLTDITKNPNIYFDSFFGDVIETNLETDGEKVDWTVRVRRN